jgi:HPt (histidine-containing phosphotransfer) domain-containing protein
MFPAYVISPSLIGSPRMSQSPILNPDAIAALRGLSPDGGNSFLREMIEIYTADTPKQFAWLDEALAQGKAADLIRAAHTIKGSSGNFGAMRLVQAAQAVEALGKAGDLAGAARLIPELKAEYAAVTESLARLLSQP